MIILNNRLRAPRFLKWYSTQTQTKKSEKQYKATIFIPNTKIISFQESIVQRDKRIQEQAKFLDCYEWQRKHMKGEEFVLHDGPPYANGALHMGHATNKIFKDIIIRSKLIQGSKVHFVPGWDCHGMPIELAVLKNCKTKLSSLELRDLSRKFALNQMELQKETFKSWGILGNWDKPYYTCDVDYVTHQIQLFWKLYEKGYIYHANMPVFWSPSSKTVLADSEVEYKDNHISPAVTVRLEVIADSLPKPTYLLIWTTSPWTLPFNKAAYYSEKLEYSLVEIESFAGSYIIATNLIESNKAKLNKEIKVIETVPKSTLKGLKYKHPWDKTEMKVFQTSETKEIATGIFHSAPAHGHVDFLLGLRDGLRTDCFVDENGCYTKEMGPELCGVQVLDKGSEMVIEKLGSDVLLKESYVHSYPYDWRTNAPVITRATNQWFIDCEKLKSKTLECLSKVSVSTVYFSEKLKKMPYWCLSRQRVWGVPIPVFTDKKTGEKIVTEEIIDHLCELFRKSGPDCWWSLDTKNLLPKRFCDELGARADDIEKGMDIMDVWFDSGISWSYVLNGKISDVCLEGVDQYRGWFQSLLLSSVALREEAPFKKLLVHGSVVDGDGKKMSKSTGNVFDPKNVTDGKGAKGADVLRFWVAEHGHQVKATVSEDIIKSSEETVKKIKNVLTYFLGALVGSSIDDVNNMPQLSHLDIYCLNESHNFYASVLSSYNDYDIYSVVNRTLFFITNTVSSLYVTSVKDRLYCDELSSRRRKSCIYTMSGMLDTLCHAIAPILPHLIEEMYLHHPIHREKHIFYSENVWEPPSHWENESADDALNLALRVRRKVFSITQKPFELECLIKAEGKDYDLLKGLQGGTEESDDSELTELLQVANAKIEHGSFDVELEKSSRNRCLRCRRFTAVEEALCRRCQDFMANFVSL